mmetsp:Transcript_21743/g.49073  ORF Transcript_21743/g.49073 Transcript_21743/m.49073 type:complete len:90 (+) Transcript_21743:134-403(+)
MLLWTETCLEGDEEQAVGWFGLGDGRAALQCLDGPHVSRRVCVLPLRRRGSRKALLGLYRARQDQVPGTQGDFAAGCEHASVDRDLPGR